MSRHLRVLWYGAHWLGLEQLPESLRGLGHHVEVIDIRGTWRVPEEEFDAVVVVMLPDKLSMPGDRLLAIRQKAPLILVSPEASERGIPPWAEIIEGWVASKCADAIVNIDGCTDFPRSEHVLTLLAPIDPTPYTPNIPWADRTTHIGFGGAIDGRRNRETARDMSEIITYRAPGKEQSDYEGYVTFMRNCRAVINFPWRAPDGGFHVKARVLETACAGAVLIERKGSPTENWFIPGEDYLVWETVDDIRTYYDWLKAEPSRAYAMARRFQEKVRANYSPIKFWKSVFVHGGVAS